MNNRHWTLPLLTLLFFFLTGCECQPESDAELCGDRQCGVASLLDRCGDTREVDCGGCEAYEDCQDHQCLCEPESDDELCAEAAATCGTLTVTDGCMEQRQIECGDCPEIGECIDNVCRCDDEPAQSLCEMAQAECGETTVTDSCGIARTIGCGQCDEPEECADNQCVCFAESDDELCAEQAGVCGPLEVVDRCNETRQLHCEPCAFGDSTLGAVRNGETGELVDDALVRVYQWPPAGGEHYDWIWSAGYRADDPDFAATTVDGGGPSGVDINFELASDEPICLGDATSASLAPHSWYRIRVDRPGFEPAYFYRYHGGYDFEDCPGLCPADDDSGCHRWDFEIWPDDATYALYPNLTIDVRTLDDREYECAILPASSPYDELIGLRAATGVANVGQGPFHLEGLPGGDDGMGVVHQHISWSDGTEESREIESEFFNYNASGQPRFMAWLRLGLVDPVDSCRDVDDRPDSCLSNEYEKLSFCLIDSDEFDRDIKTQYGGLTALFTDPPICSGGYQQGITQGWKDVYQRTLPGQLVILGPPSVASSLGQVWLEAFLDPREVLFEEDRNGNVARITVDIPTDTHTICDDPARTIDCTVPPYQYSNEQRWGCPRYLDFE